MTDTSTLHNRGAAAQAQAGRECRPCYRRSLYPLQHLCYKPDIARTTSFFDGSRVLDREGVISSQALAHKFDRQDAVFARAFDVLRDAIAAQSFPSATIAITQHDELVALRGFGRFTYEAGSREVDAETLFDLASLTKVLATTSMAMILYQRGLLDLETPVATILPKFAGEDPRRRHVSVAMLLAHASGLPAYEKLFLRAGTREALLELALQTPLGADPGSRAEYSDIGFIVLGAALELIADDSLDHFCRREVFGPLGMASTTFRPGAELRPAIPPTQDDRSFRHRIIQGEVQDENASVLGGVAGHAGLFAPVGDVARFAHAMLQGGRPILRPETVALFTRRASLPAGTARTLGWDTPSPPSQSGKYLSPSAYGHLGYTGTSLWIDPERQLSVTVLTNRTWPDCSNQSIKLVRPRVHDAVIEALEANR